MTHILKHLDSDVKLIIDSHTDKNTLSELRKAYKNEMAKYEVTGNFVKHRGILVLIRKSCGYRCINFKIINTNTLQFDLKSPSGFQYNVVAIYAPDRLGATYWT